MTMTSRVFSILGGPSEDVGDEDVDDGEESEQLLVGDRGKGGGRGGPKVGLGRPGGCSYCPRAMAFRVSAQRCLGQRMIYVKNASANTGRVLLWTAADEAF